MAHTLPSTAFSISSSVIYCCSLDRFDGVIIDSAGSIVTNVIIDNDDVLRIVQFN
jgi:hypothetical protein